MKRVCYLLALAFVLLSSPSAFANPEECQDAIDKYKSAVSDLSDGLRAYTTCVSDSRGHDDCSSEFSRLRSDQDDFESAVSAYGSDCD
jgi:hypothetical protein